MSATMSRHCDSFGPRKSSSGNSHLHDVDTLTSSAWDESETGEGALQRRNVDVCFFQFLQSEAGLCDGLDRGKIQSCRRKTGFQNDS